MDEHPVATTAWVSLAIAVVAIGAFTASEPALVTAGSIAGYCALLTGGAWIRARRRDRPASEQPGPGRHGDPAA